MNWLMVKNDLKQNKAINLVLLLFMMFSACLTIVSVEMVVQTVISISGLYEVAQPPHFLQMHKGELEEEEINRFMASYEGLEDSQIVEMIDIYGDNLTVIGEEGTRKLTECRLDIGLVKQTKSRDLLLNGVHEKVALESGEMGIPVLLRDGYGIEYGDTIVLDCDGKKREFVVAEFVLDAQMNSTMCSSTRILLSDADFDALAGTMGDSEYLIEAYFTDASMASNFQTAYENAKLPQNGQAITYSIMFLLSALTDLVTVFVLLLASVLFIGISFLCIKFTMMAALEEDISEIGSMKAIGLPFQEIRSLYLGKYRMLALVGVLLGFVLAFFVNNVVTEHIRTTFGGGGMPVVAYPLAIIATVLVYLVICHHCKMILKKIKTVSVVDALVYKNGFDKKKIFVKDGLHRSKWMPVNWLVGCKEVRDQGKNWFVVFAVTVIAAWLILIPINLLNTMKAPEFVTYMGSSLEDVLVEVENGAGLEEHYIETKQLLSKDPQIQSLVEYKRICMQMKDGEGVLKNIHIDCGTDAGEGLQYLEGTAPKNNQEIALSLLNQSVAQKEVGDELILYGNGKAYIYRISGIYQDVTSGGYTAKVQNDFARLEAEKYSFAVGLLDSSMADEKAVEWSRTIGNGVTILPMEDFLNQTLGGVVQQLDTIVLLVSMIGTFLAVLITVLFLKLRLAKDVSEIKALKVLGFSQKDIRKQYLIKIGVVSTAGILVGIVTGQFFGESIIGFLLNVAGLGIKKVQFVINPFVSWMLCPVGLLLLILLVTRGVAGEIKKVGIVE